VSAGPRRPGGGCYPLGYFVVTTVWL
jgi:hypothetical protein